MRPFIATDGLVLRQQEAELVDPVQQAVAGEALQRKLALPAVGSASVQLATSMLTSTFGCSSNQAWVCSSTTTGSNPFLRQLVRKMSANSVLMTAANPKS